MKTLAAFLVVTLVALAGTAARGEPPPEQDYALYCMGCHQRDGAGFSGRVPPLRDVDRLLRVPDGRAYLVRVPGVAHASLSNERLAILLNWVLTEFGTSGFPPYTAKEVGPLRTKSFINAAAARRALVLRLGRRAE